MRDGPRAQLAFLFGVTLAVALTLAVACGDNDSGSSPTVTPAATATEEVVPTATVGRSGLAPSELVLTSSDFADNGEIPANYTCDGDSISPPLSIAGVPAGTASLALTVTDIDGPAGNFVHWTVWNIDPATTDVPAATVPQGGVQGQTGVGAPGYFGPCPPSGEHHYVFELYALDEALSLDPAVSAKAELLAAMQGHILSQAKLTGTYQR